jgi:pimeloyl-ACP methyl ester carboxylesterase
LELETLVGDLEQLRRDSGFARASFVGHSLGAVITAAYALKYPELVKALCLLAAPAAQTQQDRQASAALLANFNQDLPGNYIQVLESLENPSERAGICVSHYPQS